VREGKKKKSLERVKKREGGKEREFCTVVRTMLKKQKGRMGGEVSRKSTFDEGGGGCQKKPGTAQR